MSEKGTKLCWLRHPSAMHDGMRLVDMILVLVFMFSMVFMFRGSGWGALLFFPGSLLTVWLSYKYIPSCSVHREEGNQE